MHYLNALAFLDFLKFNFFDQVIFLFLQHLWLNSLHHFYGHKLWHSDKKFPAPFTSWYFKCWSAAFNPPQTALFFRVRVDDFVERSR